MKKRLNTESIANELRGGSAFFPDYETGNRGTEAKTADVADVQQTTPEAHSHALASPQTAIGREEIGLIKSSSGEVSPEKKQGKATITPRYHDTIKWRCHFRSCAKSGKTNWKRSGNPPIYYRGKKSIDRY
jgi:hypothetical protein